MDLAKMIQNLEWKYGVRIGYKNGIWTAYNYVNGEVGKEICSENSLDELEITLKSYVK